MGSYPDLQAEAYMWDGETEPQHAGRIIERVESDGGEVVTNDAAGVTINEVPEGQGGFDFSSSATKNDVRGTMYDVRFGSSAAAPRGEGDVSMSAREVRGGERYRVVNDNVGLSEHLNDVVEPVELNVKLTGARRDWMKEARDFFVKYLANRVFSIGETGFMLHTEGSKVRSSAVSNVSTEKGARIFEKLEDVIKKAVHLGSQKAEHKEKEGVKRKAVIDKTNTFEFFGYPLRVNGKLFLMWFNGTTKKKGKNDKEEPDQKQVRLYEVGFQPMKEGAFPELTASRADAHGDTPSTTTMADVLRNVNEKSEWMPETHCLKNKVTEGT